MNKLKLNAMDVTEGYCKIVSEFYAEDRKNINHTNNSYIEAYKLIVNFNKKYNGLPENLKPYISHRNSKIVIELI